MAVTAVSYQSYTQDGTQVLPVTALGTDYFAEAYRGLPGFNEFYKSELLIVATLVLPDSQATLELRFRVLASE